MVNKGLPPGFRFHPTDVELVKYYLKRKVLGKKFHFDAIAELDIYKHAPWDLPDRSLMRTGDLKWYFFCAREKKYSSGTRMNRATDLGYWKTTGKDRPVHYKTEVVGMIKTLVFHRGKAPKGDRTDWVMYEYRLEENDLSSQGIIQNSYVLCSVFKKDGPGPRSGAQYGAPFNEEEWDDDDDDAEEEVNGALAVFCANMSAPIPLVDQNQSIAASLLSPPEVLPSTTDSVAVVAGDHGSSLEPPQDSIEDDDIFAMLANFSEDMPFALAENGVNEQVDALNPIEMTNNHDLVGKNDEAGHWTDGLDIFNDLGDLGNLAGYNEHENSSSACHDFNYTMEAIPVIGDGQFLELMDLDVPLNSCSDAGGHNQVQSDLHCIANHSSLSEIVSGSSEFGKGNNFVENSNEGWYDFQSSALTDTNAVFCQTSDTGSEQTSEPIRRAGEEERNSYSVLQYHLESVEGVKRLSSDVGSSIHVKAEVIVRTRRCTKDALSEKLEESLCIIYGVKRWSSDVGSSIHVKAEVTVRTRRCTKDALPEKLEESLCIIYGVCHLAKQENLGFLIFIYYLFDSDTQLVSSISLVRVLSFHLHDPLSWVKEVKLKFTSSVNNMYLKFVITLLFLLCAYRVELINDNKVEAIIVSPKHLMSLKRQKNHIPVLFYK